MADRFISNLTEIRRRARQHVLEGAVTPGYHGDRDKVVAMLQEALATELVCVLRYKQHSFVARGIQAGSVVAAGARFQGQTSWQMSQPNRCPAAAAFSASSSTPTFSMVR